ncbi:MAG: hypothetical protein E6J53_06205 [Chloroflexi bacterium]|nr:MAG: hypothetical protein E6J53_06205 [Chloroflexota bacterium]
MTTPSGGFAAANLTWTKVDVLTAYQRITAEIQVRGHLRDTINDPEPHFHLRNISAEPLLPGAVPVNGVPEGLFNKALVGGIRTIDPEPQGPDQVLDLMRRYIMFQAGTFMVTGAAEFPKASEAAMHTEILLKGRFFPIVDATITLIGAAGKVWTQPSILVNTDQMLGVYLG